MAAHSSILAWEIPWTEEAGWLQFMESQRVGHDWTTKQQQQQQQNYKTAKKQYKINFCNLGGSEGLPK